MGYQIGKKVVCVYHFYTPVLLEWALKNKWLPADNQLNQIKDMIIIPEVLFSSS